MRAWQYLLIALPLLSTVVFTFGQIVGLIVGALGVFVSYVVMRSQRPANVRLIFSLIIAVLAPVVGVVAVVVLNNALGVK
jgi:hypothetical protein